MRKAAVSAVLVVVLVVAGASCGDHEAEPTIPTVDFTPKATITVDETGITCSVLAVTTTCDVPSGSVVEAVNAGDGEHRLVATVADTLGNTFDTGVMLPGDTTTLVLTADGSFTVTDMTEPDHTLPLTVTPR